MTISTMLQATSLTLPIDVFAAGDYLRAGYAQSTSTAALTLKNLTNTSLSITKIGLANSTNEIECVPLTMQYPDTVTIPANGSITFQNNGDATNLFADNIVELSTGLLLYFEQNPSAYGLGLDLLYVYVEGEGVQYIALPGSFTTALSVVRDRLRVISNTFNKSVYKIGETITGTITLMNQGTNSIGFRSPFGNYSRDGYGRYILGNADLTSGIFEGYNDMLFIDGKSTATLSFSTVAAYTQEMEQYLIDHPNERGIAINTLTNKYAYKVYRGMYIAAYPEEQYSTIPLASAASIAGSIYAPVIESFTVTRAVNGVPSDEGQELLVSMKVSAASTPLPASFALTIADSDGNTIDATAFIPDAMTSAGVVDDGTVITALYSAGNDYAFTLTFGDAYESVSATYTISNAFANLHLSGQPTGGACFGGFSASTLNNPMLESYYPIKAYSDLEVDGKTTASNGLVVVGGESNLADENGAAIIPHAAVVYENAFNITYTYNSSRDVATYTANQSGVYLCYFKCAGTFPNTEEYHAMTMYHVDNSVSPSSTKTIATYQDLNKNIHHGNLTSFVYLHAGDSIRFNFTRTWYNHSSNTVSVGVQVRIALLP